MKASQNPPEVCGEASCRDDGPASGNLVIENLAEFAAAGVSGYCWICWADYAASLVPV